MMNGYRACDEPSAIAATAPSTRYGANATVAFRAEVPSWKIIRIPAMLAQRQVKGNSVAVQLRIGSKRAGDGIRQPPQHRLPLGFLQHCQRQTQHHVPPPRE